MINKAYSECFKVEDCSYRYLIMYKFGVMPATLSSIHIQITNVDTTMHTMGIQRVTLYVTTWYFSLIS